MSKRRLTKEERDFLEEIAKDCETKEFEEGIKEAAFGEEGYCFVGSLKGPGFVDKLYRDGRRVTGRVESGEWVPLK